MKGPICRSGNDYGHDFPANQRLRAVELGNLGRGFARLSPKSMTSLIAGFRASGNGAASMIVPHRISIFTVIKVASFGLLSLSAMDLSENGILLVATAGIAIERVIGALGTCAGRIILRNVTVENAKRTAPFLSCGKAPVNLLQCG